MFCEQCGTKLGEGDLFCMNCGARVTVAAAGEQDDDKTVILHEENGFQEGQQEARSEESDMAAVPAEEAKLSGMTEVEEVKQEGTAQTEETEEPGTAEPAEAEKPGTVETGEAGSSGEAGAEVTESMGTPEASDMAEKMRESSEPAEAKTETVETVAISPTGVVETGTAVVVPEEAQQKKFCPNCGAPNGMNDLFCQQCGMFFGNAAEKMEGQGASGKAHKKGSLWKIAAAAAAVLVVIGLGVVLVPRIFGGTAAKGQDFDFVMYLKDNELTMARKNKYEPVVIGDRMYDDSDAQSGYNYNHFVQYSPDHQYVYYPQKIDDEGCDLYRKKIGSKKAEEEKIDSKVSYYEIIDNDRIYYVKDNEDNKLYLYNKGESEKVASDVWNVQVSVDGKYIMWLDDNRLYVQDTALKADKMKLDSDVFQVYAASDDFNKIVYQKEDRLYVMTGMEDKEKIASDVYQAYIYDINGNLKMYYIKTGEQANISYYDLIDDDCLAQDQQMAEPQIEDYQRVTYKDSFWGRQKRVEVDDSYYDDLEQYQKKVERDYLRDSLDNDMLAMEEWDIYYYEEAAGESNKVMSALQKQGDMVYVKIAENSALMYAYNIEQDRIEEAKLSEFADSAYYEIQQEITKQLDGGRQLLYIENGEVHEIEGYEADDEKQSIYLSAWANEEKQILYICDFGDEDERLYSLHYGSKDASLELITDELMRVVSWDMDEICYINEDEELYYGDTKIAEEVGPCKVWENDAILYLTDMNKDGNEGTLHLYDYRSGEDTEIAEDVAPVGGYGIFDANKVVFLTDYNFKKSRGDLNVYDGKEVQNIDTDVTGIIF